MSATPKLVKVQRLDSILLDESFFTPEGFFIDNPKVTRTGIFEYIDKKTGKKRRELRLPKHVFALESLASYEGKPVIITHDAERVTKNNVKEEIVGTMLSKGYKDGDDVRVKVVVHDINSAKRSGYRELSLGYDLDLDETPGVWQGKPYDAIQTNIVINHLALVRDARAGDQARLNLDSQNKKGATCMGNAKTLNGVELQTVIKLIEASRKGRRLDEAELAIITELADLGETLGTDAVTKGADKNGDAETTLSPEGKFKLLKEKFDNQDAGIKAKDGYPNDILEGFLEYVEYLEARYDAKVAVDTGKPADASGMDEKTPAMNADSVDAVVKERIRLGRLGDKLNIDGLDELSPIEAKKAIVKAVLPNMRLDGKGEVYINVAFDQAVEQISTRKDINYQRQQMSHQKEGAVRLDGIPQTTADEARMRMIERRNGGSAE